MGIFKDGDRVECVGWHSFAKIGDVGTVLHNYHDEWYDVRFDGHKLNGGSAYGGYGCDGHILILTEGPRRLSDDELIEDGDFVVIGGQTLRLDSDKEVYLDGSYIGEKALRALGIDILRPTVVDTATDLPEDQLWGAFWNIEGINRWRVMKVTDGFYDDELDLIRDSVGSTEPDWR